MASSAHAHPPVPSDPLAMPLADAGPVDVVVLATSQGADGGFVVGRRVDGDLNRLVAVEVDAQGLAVAGPVVVAPTYFPPYLEAASTTTGLVVVWYELGDATSWLRGFGPGLTPLADRTIAAEAEDFELACSDTLCLVCERSIGSRCRRFADGVPLDAVPIELPPNPDPEPPVNCGIAAVEWYADAFSVFLGCGTMTDPVSLLRVTADGIVLDDPAVGLPIPTGPTLVAVADAQALVVVEQNDPFAWRLDDVIATPGDVVTPSATAIDLTWRGSDYELLMADETAFSSAVLDLDGRLVGPVQWLEVGHPLTALGGNVPLVLFHEGESARPLAATASFASSTLGESHVVFEGPPSHGSPLVTRAADTTLALWTEVGEPTRGRFVRIGSEGAILDPVAAEIPAAGSVIVHDATSLGDRYVILWSDDARGVVGTVGPEAELIERWSGPSTVPVAACASESGFLVLLQDGLAVRFDASAQPLDAVPFATGQAVGDECVWNGEAWIVRSSTGLTALATEGTIAWTVPAPPCEDANGCWLAAVASDGAGRAVAAEVIDQGEATTIQARRLDESGVFAEPVVLVTGSVSAPQLAHDGEHFIAAWSESIDPYGGMRTVIAAFDGALQRVDPFPLLELDGWSPSLARDGSAVATRALVGSGISTATVVHLLVHETDDGSEGSTSGAQESGGTSPTTGSGGSIGSNGSAEGGGEGGEGGTLPRGCACGRERERSAVGWWIILAAALVRPGRRKLG